MARKRQKVNQVLARRLRRSDPHFAIRGGGDATPNYALIQIANDASTLTVANRRYTFQEEDLSIVSQSGNDFSVGTYTDTAQRDSGAIFSARGGMFQVGAFFGQGINDPVIDEGGTLTRYLQLGIRLGDDISPNSLDLSQLGLDLLIPLGVDGSCAASVPGIARPGGPAAWQFFVDLKNRFGTDSVPLDMFGFTCAMVWQIG